MKKPACRGGAQKSRENTVLIRKAKLRDVNKLAEMAFVLLDYHSKYDRELYSGPSKKKQIKLFKQRLKRKIFDKNGLLLVAELNSEIIGYLMASIQDRTALFKVNKWAHIHDIFVEKNFRGRGIGRKLIKTTKRFFKKKGLKYLELEVHPKNTQAMRNYEKLGFREFEQQMVLKL